MAYLTAISGSGFGKRTDITKVLTVLGRHPECDVVIEVGAVSRQHARIEMVGQSFVLHDLKSRNGTFLNGQLIDKPAELHDGDLIRICDMEYSFHNPTIQGSSELQIEGSTYGVMLVDDAMEVGLTREVQSKLDIRDSAHGTQLTTTAETRLKAVLEITQKLGRSVRLEEVLPKVLDTLFQVFLQADRAFVVLVEGDQLIPRWIKTRHEEQHENFHISRTVMREVMESRQAIISLDASSDERFEMAQSIANFRIRSMIVAPLLNSAGEAIGAIQMDTLDSKRHFEKGDLEILYSIAVQAGIAIENAQLHEIVLEQNRVEQDLALARQVQKAFLPSRAPQVPGFRFFDYYGPADEVGGDYFDYIFLGDDQLAVIVADVVGHGVAAAMLMAKLSAEARYCLASQDDLAAAVSLLNQRISSLDLQRFVTLLCLRIEIATGKVEIVNAGHMLPVWKRHHAQHMEQPGSEQAGIPLGIMEDTEYQCVSLQMEPGDELLLFTDGISEAPNAAGHMFGIERLCQHARSSNGDLQLLGNSIIEDVTSFTQDTRQADDMCLVLIQRS
jgi:sigma-B regulation protein RsbU (phosphoserine phosphatase)